MSANQGQSRGQGSSDFSADTPNGWTYPLAAFLKRHDELVSGLELFNRIQDCDKALTKAGCEGYARWLKSKPEALPENPPAEDEAAALKAFLHSFEGVRSSNLVPPLRPDQAMELDELRSRAMRAMRDRLRQLESALAALEENRRPAVPTRDYCLVPPNKLRWEGEVEVQQRLWHLLRMVLDAEGEAISFAEIEEEIHRDKTVKNKTIANEIHELNRHLLDLHFPWGVRPKRSHLLRKPEGP